MPTEELYNRYRDPVNDSEESTGNTIDWSSVSSFEELLRQELSLTDTNSYPSAPVTAIDLTEPISVDAEFFYNFYTRDERTVTPGVHTVVDIANTAQNLEQVKRNLRTPRNGIISVVVPDRTSFLIGKSEDQIRFVLRQAEKFIPTVEHLEKYNRKNQIVFEGAVANHRYSSIILQDNQVDDTFYKVLENSVAFRGAYSKTGTDSELGNFLDRYFRSPMAEASATPSSLRNVMSNYQPSGIAYAATDARREVIAEALRDVRFAEFSLTIHNGLAHHIILGGLEDRGNIYQDEFIALEPPAKALQELYRQNPNPGTIDASEFDLEMAAIDITKMSEFAEMGILKGMNEIAYPVAILVEKHEIVTNPDGTFSSKKLKPIITKYGSVNIFDPGVRYGTTYIYRARIVYLTVYEATAVDPLGNTPDEPVFATSLIASQGLKAQMICLESISPDPPRNLVFNYDFFDDTLDIFWQEPTNRQRDVIRYQIFRRNNIREPFEIIGELDFDNSTSRVNPLEKTPSDRLYRVGGPRKWFKDKGFNRDKTYIYALACVDARGLTSSYSEQIEVKFDRFKNSIVVKRISPPKAPKPYPNLYLKRDLFVDAMKTSGKNRMRIFFDPEYFEVIRTSYETETGETTKAPSHGIASPKDRETKVNTPLGFIKRKYKLHIINLDLQDGNIFDINIGDDTFDITEIPFTNATIRSVL